MTNHTNVAEDGVGVGAGHEPGGGASDGAGYGDEARAADVDGAGGVSGMEVGLRMWLKIGLGMGRWMDRT